MSVNEPRDTREDSEVFNNSRAVFATLTGLGSTTWRLCVDFKEVLVQRYNNKCGTFKNTPSAYDVLCLIKNATTELFSALHQNNHGKHKKTLCFSLDNVSKLMVHFDLSGEWTGFSLRNTNKKLCKNTPCTEVSHFLENWQQGKLSFHDKYLQEIEESFRG